MRRLLCVSLVMVAASVVLATPPDLVTTCGDEFVHDGQSYRFIGMNIRGLVHYGGGDALPYSNLGHIEENLAGAAGFGCRVARVFAANKHISHQEAVNRLGYALDRAHAHGIKLIIALTDFYNTPFHPQGDDGYYQSNPGGWTVLNHAWFAGGYQNNYLPYVTLAVSTHKNHPAVFSWQLGNEIADQSSADTHDAFVHAMAAHIKSIDPHHMVSIGMLSLAHIPGYSSQRGVELYSDPNLDFITAHRYNDDTHPIDFNVRDLVNKPIVISEAGCQVDHPAVGGDRVAFMDERIQHFVHALGARGFMNWGYQAQGYDIGDGDNMYGIDQYAHSDYWPMTDMYGTHAGVLNAYDEPVAPRLPPRGRNLSLDAAAWQADSVYGPGWGGDQAFDGVLSTKWTSTNAAGTHWLALDLGQTWPLTGIRVQMAGAGGEWSCFNFELYTLQLGSSLDGPWTTAFDIDNSGKLDTVTSVFDTPTPARYVRIHVTDSGLDDYARLPELAVIGDPYPIGDLDGDDDGDLVDMSLLQRCFRGDAAPYAGDLPGCDCGNANVEQGCGDPPTGDVDFADFAILGEHLLGPAVSVRAAR